MSSELRRNRRKLRKAGARIILSAYSRHVKGYICMIGAPTNTGKTWNIQWKIIPSDIEKGYTHFLYVTSAKDNVEQEYNDFMNSLYGKAHVTKDLDFFLSYDDSKPIVLVTTISMATNKTGSRDNGQEILDHLEDKNFCCYRDEGQYGGSGSKETVALNTGNTLYKKSKYTGTYFSFMDSLSLLNENCKVTMFSATPLFEQMELLRGIVPTNDRYRYLNNKDEWTTLDECAELHSQTRLIHTYDDFDTGMFDGLNDFYSFKQTITNLAKKIMKVHPELNLTPNPVCMINVAQENSRPLTARNLRESLDLVTEFCQNHGNQTDLRFGRADTNGYFNASVIDCENSTWNNVNSHLQFVKDMMSPNHPLEIVFHINKLCTGLNCPNITHLIAMRERSQKANSGVPKIPTITPLQSKGRTSRTWFGMKIEFNFVSDVVEWLIQEYPDSPVFDDICEYFKLCNSHTFFTPNSDVYLQAKTDWTNEKMPYAVSIEQSQFNGLYVADKNSEHFKKTGDKIMSSPSQIERDLSYQSYREEVGYCEHHPDGSCKENVRKLDKFKNLSDEEFDVLYLKTLDVDHINGDRNDMRKENLQVGCKNVHSAKSILDGDHDPNKYKKT